MKYEFGVFITCECYIKILSDQISIIHFLAKVESNKLMSLAKDNQMKIHEASLQMMKTTHDTLKTKITFLNIFSSLFGEIL